MRILRGRDYYDSALALGQDDDVQFVRTRKYVGVLSCPLDPFTHAPNTFVVEGSDARYPSYTSDFVEKDDRNRTLRTMDGIVVYFAGKRYSGLFTRTPLEVRAFWNYESLDRFAHANGLTLNPGNQKTLFKRSSMTLRDAFEPRPATDKELAWMVENRVAIALYTPESRWGGYEGFEPRDKESSVPWRCNSAEPEDALKRYGFAKALDPFSAMQELSMFVGGVMGGADPNTVKITDEKTLVKKHGFDEWSFRKKGVAK